MLFFALGLSIFMPEMLGQFDQYPGDLVDTRFNHVILEHHYQYLSGQHDHFWSTRFFYPAPNMLAGSDAHFSTMPIYSFFRFIGCSMFTSFQLWFLVLLFLNYFICYKVLRWFKLDPIAASIGAFLFTFSMPVALLSGHIQNFNRFAIPLVFYFAYQWLSTFNYKYYLRLLLALLLLFYSSLYMVLLTAIPLFFLFFVYSIAKFTTLKSHLKNTSFTLKNALYYIIPAIVLFVVCLPVINKYLQAGKHVPTVTRDLLSTRLPSIWAYIIPHAESLWYAKFTWPLQQGIIQPWDKYFSIGFLSTFILLTGTILLFRKHTILAVFSITCMLTLLWFIYVNGHSPYFLIKAWPGYNHLNVPSRFFLIALFLIAFCMAFVVQQTMRWHRYIVPFILGLLVFNDNLLRPNALKHMPIEDAKTHHLVLKNCIDQNKKPSHEAFVLLPQSDSTHFDFIDILDVMVTAYDSKINCINGYSTFGPPYHPVNWMYPKKSEVIRWLTDQKFSKADIDKKVLVIEKTDQGTYRIKE